MHINDAPTQFLGQDRLATGLLVLRLVLASYIHQWGLLHWRYTEAAIDVYQRWYGFAPPEAVVEGLGYILVLMAASTILGLARPIAYGVLLLFQALLVIGLIPHLLNPYGFHQPPNWINHGLIAQVTALAGYVALFLLWKSDVFSVDEKLRKGGTVAPVSPGDGNAGVALLTIRIAAALFFLQWGVEKFVEREMSVGMMERWYGVASATELAVIAAGVSEILLAVALAAGAWRRPTYGIAVAIKFATCIAIAGMLFFPFANENGGRMSGVAASIPTLGTLWFLYWARAWDALSFDAKRSSSRSRCPIPRRS